MDNNINDIINNLGINMNGQKINLKDIIKVDIGALNNLNMLIRLNETNNNDNNNDNNSNINREELLELLNKSNALVEYSTNILNKINNNTQ